MKKTIDIIIPFYNPCDSVLTSLEENILQLSTENKIPDFQIILVNDGSTKQNYKPFIEKFEMKFPNFSFLDLKENQGKGGAIKKGLELSKAPIVIFYDIDFPFSRKGLYDCYQTLITGKNDISVARRDNNYQKKLPFKRKILSLTIKFFIQILSKGKIKDSQAGLKGFYSDCLPILQNTKCNSFLMDFEFLLTALKQNKKIADFLVTPNQNIQFTNFSNRILQKEIKSLLKILIK